MAKVLVLSDGSCQGLPAPAHVTMVAMDGLTVGGLFSLLDSHPGLLHPPGGYDIIILHVGAHNLRHSPSVQTLVSLLDLLVLKVQSLSPWSKVLVSSLVPWPACSPQDLSLLTLTNKALSLHFGKHTFIRTYFKLVRGQKARQEMFEGEGPQLSAQGRQCLWSSLANFLRYLKAK